MLRALPLLLLLAPLPALANGSAREPDCGGDAYSSATIGTNPPGPLTAVPDTLCADLEQGQAPGTRIEIIAPGITSPGLAPPSPYGDRYAPAPYDGRPLPGPRPRGGRDPER
ncbi:hypothetical protein [Methylobacterium frigidaeris]|uniref:Uncharacterized protein n=1 Tax=Methylobacterium frigidaeris TaxID=2038277 RepID=A0AA37HGI3_9HYPH|nr:hypothetical protein [Methylobacterium frigidaeris]PIK72461.1 hypothetical protein CS379_13840 [Methylobacterium frigidaeris]GJD65369.1 hypothetical protein MPEAHAMD_5557 [Methylobacterium frigidaeris]